MGSQRSRWDDTQLSGKVVGARGGGLGKARWEHGLAQRTRSGVRRRWPWTRSPGSGQAQSRGLSWAGATGQREGGLTNTPRSSEEGAM